MSKDSRGGWKKITDALSDLREGASLLVSGTLQNIVGKHEKKSSLDIVPVITEKEYEVARITLVNPFASHEFSQKCFTKCY